MTNTLPVDLIRKEGRLLFVLLDAGQSNGKIAATPHEKLWLEAKDRVLLSGDFESDAPLFYEMLDEIDSSGVLSDTWIERRWLTIKRRVTGTN